MLLGFGTAIANAPDDQKQYVRIMASEKIFEICASYMVSSQTHTLQFIALDNAWDEHIARVEMVLLAMGQAHQYNPTLTPIIEAIITICTLSIEGVAYNDDFNPNGTVRRVTTITPECEARLTSMLNDYVTKMKRLVPAYQYKEPKKASTCFIATVTMGDHNHPVVIVLREFRDIWLVRKWYGRLFVRWYYTYGSYPAVFISRSALRRQLSYFVIVRPLAWIAQRLLA
jgi:hypothetical protein